LGKFDQIWTKSKACIPKNIRSPTAMLRCLFAEASWQVNEQNIV